MTAENLERAAPLAARKLPRWEELPDLDLYMDQVLSLIHRYLGREESPDGKVLTSSMVNNYVKMRLMPAPEKKKYSRVHLAYLIAICVLKTSLPMAAVRDNPFCTTNSVISMRTPDAGSWRNVPETVSPVPPSSSVPPSGRRRSRPWHGCWRSRK